MTERRVKPVEEEIGTVMQARPHSVLASLKEMDGVMRNLVGP